MGLAIGLFGPSNGRGKFKMWQWQFMLSCCSCPVLPCVAVARCTGRLHCFLPQSIFEEEKSPMAPWPNLKLWRNCPLLFDAWYFHSCNPLFHLSTVGTGGGGPVAAGAHCRGVLANRRPRGQYFWYKSQKATLLKENNVIAQAKSLELGNWTGDVSCRH